MHDYDLHAVYGDARLYDQESGGIVKDLGFYLAEGLRSGGPVLECGCGTGRVTLPLARAGLAVTGLEYSAPMLDLAKERAAAEGLPVEWVLGDMRTWSGGRRFRLVCVPFNALLHLYDRESVEAFLARCKEHLLPGGVLAFDIFLPNPRYLVKDAQERRLLWENLVDRSGNQVSVWESNHYDGQTQMNHVTWWVRGADGTETVQHLNMRMFYPQEMDALLHYSGFRVVRKEGDFEGAPFVPTSHHQVYVCEVEG